MELPRDTKPTLSDAERRRIVVEWNDTAREYPHARGIHELFADQAARTPDAIALVHAGIQVTYRELDHRANRLARHLVGLGVSPDVLVGICVARSVDMVVGLLGILKAGGAYLPIDPSYPAERIAFMLDDARPRIVLAHGPTVSRLACGPTVRIVVLDAERETIARQDPGVLPNAAGPRNLAYVIYTSGSTGKPKGAAIEHRGLTNYLMWAREAYSLESGAGAPVHSSLSFDLTVTSLYLPLLVGSTVTLVAGDDVEALAASLSAVGDHGLIKITPAHLDVLARQLTPEVASRASRGFVIGGDALHGDSLDFWRANAPSVRLWNEYGPTETVVGCCVYELPVGAELPPAVPIGRPIANTRLYVLDEQLEPTPIGISGELYIGGDGVARGYLDRPALTAERFVPDPFGSAGDRLYRTGDLARYRADGILEYLGRVDHQVKIRGYRVELGEIEAALALHPSVREAVVVAREDTPGAKRLVGYVVGRDAVPDLGALREYLQAKLPEYMVPSALVVLEALPLTANGKADRKALPAPARAIDSSASNAADPIAAQVRSIWAELLLLGDPHPEGRFLEVGGHSLAAMELVIELEKRVGAQVPLRFVLESPTLAALIELVRGSARTAASRQRIARRKDRYLAPLSPVQQRIWFHEQLHPGGAAYVETPVLWIEGPLEQPRLLRALELTAERHATWRTSFQIRAGEPVQVIDKRARLSLSTIDARGCPSEDRRAHVRAIALSSAAEPFRIDRAPLVRPILVVFAEDCAALLLVMHHLVTDAWSEEIVADELSRLYDSLQRGAAPNLPALPIDYGDFAAWQRELQASETRAADLAYWRDLLQGAPTVVQLPCDRDRPATPRFRGETVELELPNDLATALRELAARSNCSLATVLNTALLWLLHRYTGQDTCLLGVASASRQLPEVQRLLGFFVDTLVVRGDFADDPTFIASIEALRSQMSRAVEHTSVAFDVLVAELAPERRPGVPPLVQVMSASQVPIAPIERAGLVFRADVVDGGGTKADLTMIVGEQPDGGIELAWNYDRDLFNRETVEQIAESYAHLLSDVVAHPERHIGSASILPSRRRDPMLAMGSSSSATEEDARNLAVHQLFEAQVDRTPDAIAAIFHGQQLTYRELDHRANQLAHRLLELGVGPEVLVGICVERTVEIVVGMLGILKAGGAYVPLDSSYPQERLAFMVEDAAVSVLVTQARLVDMLPSHRARLVCLDADRSELASQSVVRPPAVGSADHLAYVIYTSGSTGTPKGICVTHRSIARLVLDTNYVALGPSDCIAQASNTSFDAATFEVWGALLNGARLVGISKEDTLAPTVLATKIREHGITTMFLTTALFNQIVHHEPTAFQPLKQLLFGGELVDARAVREALRHAPRRLLHVYGPTETTTFATWYEIKAVPEGATTVPIGRPLANASLYVLDRDRKLVPIGVPGELYIGGDGLARGYLNRPELTRDKFVDHPFGEGRLYRTGDFVRWLPDGNIEFIGRIDHQVKIRGFRIELGEIEAQLARHPSIREAVVLVRQDGNDDKRLVAYVVGHDAAPDPHALRAHLKGKLPEYMVPSSFVLLDALPLTPNGKVDRARLLASRQDEVAGASARDVRPMLPIEQLMADLWATVLGREVGLSDDFFEAGGHSLLLLRLQRLIHERLLAHVPLSELFAPSRLSDMSATVVRHRTEKSWKLTPITSSGGPDYPAASVQERIWLSHEGGNNNPVGELLVLDGPLALDALQGALTAIFDGHASLRTTFHLSDAGLIQRVHPPGSLPFELIDLTEEPEVEREAIARAACEELAGASLDLAEGPLFRVLVVRLAPERHFLLLKFDHTVVDGWSFDILFRDLERIYAGLLEGRTSVIRPALEPGDVAQWERRTLTEENLADQIAFWRRELSGSPRRLTLDLARPRPPVPSHRGRLLHFDLPPQLRPRLLEICRREGVTQFMVGLAAFALTMRRFGGGDDLVIGTPVAMRDRSEVRDLVGCFLNELPIRVRLDKLTSHREAIRRVREAALRAYDNADVPFEMIVRGFDSREPGGAAPVFQVMFEMVTLEKPPRLARLAVSRQPVQVGVALLDITVALEDDGACLRGWLEYSEDLFGEQDARLLVAELERTMLAIAGDADSHPVGPPPRAATADASISSTNKDAR
ncbi:MAG: linear gramicidin synthase subunit [Myxococcales bacterium]|nr:linear gramicidin synthase subunit [Myxococcales bacterium]